MPTTPTSSADTLRATAASSPAYARLWKGLTTHAVQPALAHQVGQSKASGAVSSRRKQRGGRKSASASSGRNASFGQKEFVTEWTQSMHELIEANRKHAARKQGRRSSKYGKNRRGGGGRSSTKQRGGFIRDGSVQYFPANNGCRAQMAGHSN